MDYLDIARKNLKIEDLKPQGQEVAQLIGLDNYIRLCESLGGSSLYIPTLKEAARQHIYSRLIRSQGVMSKKELARFYGLSKSTVYKLLKDAGK